jgi:hypothetical protein
MSLGFWVNDNIINNQRVKQQFGYNLATVWLLTVTLRAFVPFL